MKIINLEKYQGYSSLAIWNDDNKGDTSIVEKNLHQLNNKIVMVGLNISKSISMTPIIWIITVYKPDPEEWINYKTRRKKS